MTRRAREDRLGFVGDMQEKNDLHNIENDNIIMNIDNEGTKIINGIDIEEKKNEENNMNNSNTDSEDNLQ